MYPTNSDLQDVLSAHPHINTNACTHTLRPSRDSNPAHLSGADEVLLGGAVHLHRSLQSVVVAAVHALKIRTTNTENLPIHCSFFRMADGRCLLLGLTLFLQGMADSMSVAHCSRQQHPDMTEAVLVKETWGSPQCEQYSRPRCPAHPRCSTS